MKKLNAIQSTLSDAWVSGSIFIHPSEDPLKKLRQHFPFEKFYAFTLLGVDYFIREINGIAPSGEKASHLVFIKDGNIYHKAVVSLATWEFRYLINDSSLRNEVFFKNKYTYVPAETVVDNLLYIGRDKDERSKEMYDSLIKELSPMVMSDDNTLSWSKASVEQIIKVVKEHPALAPFADANQGGEIK
ncbi:hypothetical protein [Photobacterium kishitanii]|uniref:Uncharacterized protein n=1 Tax=Photobacterium kishitanii TaxID=318456 RepID=A0A2T3KLL8_9GAMM|nr:hypothetical protein [Photobacterium kishitanii]PSV00581.1 hypothetical protein C9J27_05450 [Photobacterium kishitanii]